MADEKQKPAQPQPRDEHLKKGYDPPPQRAPRPQDSVPIAPDGLSIANNATGQKPPDK